MSNRNQTPLFGVVEGGPSPQAVTDAFDQARLTQARQLAGMTKKDLAERIGVTPAAVGQYETGMTRPRPELVPRLADALGVPPAFFLLGRPHGKLDGSMAHFRSLRSTRAHQRAKAAAFVEQVWELAHALEKQVRLPDVALPGFSGGAVHSDVELPRDPVQAARALRRLWGLGTGPLSHVVRHMEAQGIVVVLPPPDEDATTVDAFSTSQLPRPIVVLTANRFDDIHRYRFTAAHELGHLVLHGDAASGDTQQEREADVFAAEFLTPRDSILPELPGRLDLRRLVELKRTWGVSVDSLLYRCREVGLISDSAASRAYQRLKTLRDQPGFAAEPISGYPGEQPVLLRQAFDLAVGETGLTMERLAAQLAWPVSRVRELLDLPDRRPALRLVPDGPTRPRRAP
ncbi:helix-turn-helix domain-containing protein [Streptosporangium amethystogenes]|uniref:helix-turn-helix domain-containing protein n=1 Tax=Streptosporangium amethystogenes TaxID=2002 RepID=UPI000A064AF1|nr:XRE family transcriptional regulator [Streptosporangium amethystogenes]